MVRIRALVALLFSFAAFSAACYVPPYGYPSSIAALGRTSYPVLPVEEAEPDVEAGPVTLKGPALPASRRDRVPSAGRAPAFDVQRARASLSRVDVSACRDSGAPRGYGHAIVTFNPDGTASKVVVDAPATMNAAAVKCIGDRLGAVSVDAYEGSFVSVGTTWFVR